MGASTLLRGQPVIKMLQEEGRGAIDCAGVFRLNFIQSLVVVVKRCHIALIDQLFLGFYVVVQAGFSQTKALCYIAQRCGP